jgi:hypothetical protein
MRPKVYRQRIKLPISEIDEKYGDLLPSTSSAFLVKSGHDKATNAHEGVVVGIEGPTAIKYEEANKDDPGALFRYNRPSIETLFSHGSGKSHVAAALGMAHKEALEQYGAAPTHSADLTPYSMGVVKSAIKKGAVVKNPEMDEWGYDETFTPSQANPLELHYAKLAGIKAVNLGIEHAESQNETVRAMSVDGSKVPAPAGFAREMPVDAVHKARKYAKNLLRPPVESAASHPQFEQLSLFPTADTASLRKTLGNR